MFNTTAWKNQPAIKRVVSGPEVHQLYTAFLGEHIRHFDYNWLRTMCRGYGTPPIEKSFTWAVAHTASTQPGSLTEKSRSKSADS
jgi:hypothetical protein